jgi:hypothetical protein
VKPVLLFGIEIPCHFDFAINTVEKTFFRFAFLTVLRMNPVMPKTDRDALQVPAFSLGIQPQCHRRAGTKCGKQ